MSTVRLAAPGHSREIAARLTDGGRLYALDQDPDAVKVATERLAPFPQAEVIQTNFCQMKTVLEARQALPVDGVLLDLGVSSWQLDNPSRGFSYREDATAGYADVAVGYNGG